MISYILGPTIQTALGNRVIPFSPDSLQKVQTKPLFVDLPLSFEPNLGQSTDLIRFLSRGPKHSFLFLDDKFILRYSNHASNPRSKSPGTKKESLELQIKFVDSNSSPKIVGKNPLKSKSHYYRGSNPKKWQTNISNFSKVSYHEIYPGVDLIFYGNQNQLEFDFILQEKTDPSIIKLDLGSKDPHQNPFVIDQEGDLVIFTKDSELRLKRPFAFQEIDGIRHEVSIDYRLEGTHKIGFQLGPYDSAYPLVIDPILTYSANGIGGSAIAVDKNGNTFITGIANPAFLTSEDAPQDIHAEGVCFNGPNLVSCPDILLAKLNRDGTELIFSTFLGGSGFEYGYDVDVDFDGNVYLTGTTSSTNFPITTDAIQTNLNTEHCIASYPGLVCSNAFVTKINSKGTNLLYSTYLGGVQGGVGGNGIVVDSRGNAYITGDKPTQGFVAKLDQYGTSIIYSLDGIGGTAIALDLDSNVYLTGKHQDKSYITKLDTEGTQIIYSFQLGGTYVPYDALPQEVEAITGIAVDESGYAYVTGYTAYEDFPTTPGVLFETAPGAGICDNSLCRDGFLSKLNIEGTDLVYSTYFGGSAIDYINGVAVDSFGNVYLTGVTLSPDFPVTEIFGSSNGQIFISKLNFDATELIYSIRAGTGENFEGGSNITVDAIGNAYITGKVGSNFLLTPGAYQAPAPNDGFVASLFDDLEIFVPIVLSSPGLSNSFFTSELTLTNRGSQTASLNFTYKAAFGGGSGSAQDTLAAGKQRILPDTINYLRELGIPIPDSGSRGGTLTIRFKGLNSSSEGAITVRTTTKVVGGRAGLAYPGVSVGFHQPTYLCGLFHNSSDRSNVAIQNMGKPGSGKITLQLTVFSGDPYNRDFFVIPNQTLLPGEFRQISGILRSYGNLFENGYVQIEKIEGLAPYYAYGVINDQNSSDGSFITPIPRVSRTTVSGQVLPAIVQTNSFRSELIVTNFTNENKIIGLSVLSDGLVNPELSYFLTIRSREQLVLSDVVAWLRNRRLPGIGLPGENFSGPLFVTTEKPSEGGLFVGTRTATQKGINRYGVFYKAIPYGRTQFSQSWIYGLQQNGLNRTNLGLVNTGETNKETNVFRIEIYNGETGLLTGTIDEIRVDARKSVQFNSILKQFAPEIEQAYVHISRKSGSNPFLAFIIINDGKQPGERTGDGALIYSIP